MPIIFFMPQARDLRHQSGPQLQFLGLKADRLLKIFAYIDRFETLGCEFCIHTLANRMSIGK